MKQALGYQRLSKDEEGSSSLDYQRSCIEQYCATHDLELIGIEQDNGISGKDMAHRPGVLAVIAAVEANAVDAIVVFKSDRLSRDAVETLQFDRLLVAKHVEYHSYSEGVLNSGSIDDEFMSCVRAGLNARERRLIAYRTRTALQRKREKGERIGGRPAYGWQVVNNEMVPNPQEQEAIARMHALNGKGYSTREVVTALKREGIHTRKGTSFTQTQVVRILKAA